LGARALRIALDYDVLESENIPDNHRFEILRGRTGQYDPEILQAFADLRGKSETLVHELRLDEIASGMLFGEDVKSARGLLLIARGQEVTPGLLERIRNFSSELGIREPIRMIERRAIPQASPAVPVAL